MGAMFSGVYYVDADPNKVILYLNVVIMQVFMLDPEQFPKGKLLQKKVVHMRQRQEHLHFSSWLKTKSDRKHLQQR